MLYDIVMFIETTSLPREVPKRDTFIGRVKFWFLRRELEGIAKGYNLVLGQEFYGELNQWTGKRPMITFSRRNEEPTKYKMETIDKYFARVFARIKTSGVGSGYL